MSFVESLARFTFTHIVPVAIWGRTAKEDIVTHLMNHDSAECERLLNKDICSSMLTLPFSPVFYRNMLIVSYVNYVCEAHMSLNQLQTSKQFVHMSKVLFSQEV